MGGGEQADERREGPMALPGRGELRTRRGAEVTVGACGAAVRSGAGAGPRPGRAERGGGGALGAVLAPGGARAPPRPGPSRGRGAGCPEAGVGARAPPSRGGRSLEPPFPEDARPARLVERRMPCTGGGWPWNVCGFVGVFWGFRGLFGFFVVSFFPH